MNASKFLVAAAAMSMSATAFAAGAHGVGTEPAVASRAKRLR